MRYPKTRKQETRTRLVEAASRHFRASGGEGISVAALMDDLQLTHGGFYRHFKSKDDLYAAAIAWSFQKMREQVLRIADLQRDPKAKLRSIIRRYLSERHCAHPEAGCPIAAMGSEMFRQSEAVRRSFDTALIEHAEHLSFLLPGKTKPERWNACVVLFNGMAGVLMTARAISDTKLRRRILAVARAHYLKIYAG